MLLVKVEVVGWGFCLAGVQGRRPGQRMGLVPRANGRQEARGKGFLSAWNGGQAEEGCVRVFCLYISYKSG